MQTPEIQNTWLTYNSTRGAVPRKASAVIVHADDSGEVLLVKRNPALAFMGGHHAFPGGAVSQDDTGRCVSGAPNIETARHLTAAVREVFEETGLLLVEGNLPDRDVLEAARRDLVSESLPFEMFIDHWRLRIRAAAFEPAGRWLTPTFAPVRFDTRYFFHRTDSALPAMAMGRDQEIIAVNWLRPRDALQKRAHGELMLSTPVAFALQRLAAFPLEAALERLHGTPGFSELLDYIEPLPGVHIVPVHAKTLPPATHTNCVILGRRELAIVDPGVSDADEQRRFLAHLEDIAETLEGAPAVILLTHNHPDHCAFAEMLSRHYKIPVCAHPLSLSGFSQSEPLEPGSYITLAGRPPWRIRCLYTPGHHPGHICYYEEQTSTLLCGDIAANPGAIMIDNTRGGNMNAYLDSLKRLSALTLAMTIPGHGAPLGGKEGNRLFSDTIAHRHMREAKIIAALNQGATTLDAVLALAYDDIAPEMHPYARRQVSAHLERLGISL